MIFAASPMPSHSLPTSEQEKASRKRAGQEGRARQAKLKEDASEFIKANPKMR